MDIDLSVEKFTEKLSSKAPTPGGGGVAALLGALSASLCEMVGNLTVGKKKYKEHEEEISYHIKEMEKYRVRLLELIEKDATAFAPLSKAYSLPANTQDEKDYKDSTLEQCLRNAAAVPLEIMETTAEVIKGIDIFAKKGSTLAVSDAAVAAICGQCAIRSAALNVYINTRLMKDREYAQRINMKCRNLLDDFDDYSQGIYQNINSTLTDTEEA